jgi:AcrR family transcriptional regulator
MAESEIAQKWIEAGYEMFALNGPKDFNVEKLAGQLGLNKSGFYHYFVDRETFFDELMKYHKRLGEQFAGEVAKLENFDPGYFNLLLKYKSGLFVQMCLRKNMNNPVFRECYEKVRKLNDSKQIPLWAKYLGIPGNHELAAELMEIARDMVYTRLSIDKLNMDVLAVMFGSIKKIVEKLSSKKKAGE